MLRTLGLVASFSVVLVFFAGMALTTSQRRLADTKLKALAQRIVGLQEEERAHVSRNLHAREKLGLGTAAQCRAYAEKQGWL